MIVGATDGEYFDYQTISASIADDLAELTFAAPVLALSSGENATAVGTVVAQSSQSGATIGYAIAGAPMPRCSRSMRRRAR